MLPLLDVFMVVLFVFATIQEQQLDSSVQELDDTSAALAEARAEAERQADRAAQLEDQLTRLEVQTDAQAQTEEQLRDRVEQYEQECGPARPGGPACPAAAVNPNAKAQAAMAALHERLLDNVAVFEVELEGEPDMTTGKVTNLCCYRPDPPSGAWKSCGEVPTDEADQRAWLDDGADGLVDGLSRTRGGNAVVLLRQGNWARYRLSNDLAELLRDRFPSHRVYDDGTTAGALECPLLDR